MGNVNGQISSDCSDTALVEIGLGKIAMVGDLKASPIRPQVARAATSARELPQKVTPQETAAKPFKGHNYKSKKRRK